MLYYCVYLGLVLLPLQYCKIRRDALNVSALKKKSSLFRSTVVQSSLPIPMLPLLAMNMDMLLGYKFSSTYKSALIEVLLEGILPLTIKTEMFRNSCLEGKEKQNQEQQQKKVLKKGNLLKLHI